MSERALPYGCGLIYRRWSLFRGPEVFINDPRFAEKLDELAASFESMAASIECIVEDVERAHYFLRKLVRSAANRATDELSAGLDSGGTP